ncbi:hypothetical protein [Streptomyces sp. NPDC050264]|uniref:hypothetical protein n=1 Tax=Streptomyces sp. NPDC050264 TaxID=3155038 RepID=UPI00341A0527
MSRRALLGYSGTAAAGAVVGASAPATAAQDTAAQDTAATDTAATDETAAVTFKRDTYFDGSSQIANTNPDYSEPDGYVRIEFRMTFERGNPAVETIEPLDIAGALNEFLASRGWPAITFYGTPEPAPLN